LPFIKYGPSGLALWLTSICSAPKASGIIYHLVLSLLT